MCKRAHRMGAPFGVRAHQALSGLFSKFTNKAWRGESGSANKRLFTVNVTQKRRLEGCALPSARMVS